MNAMDYYQTLGVDKSAGQKEIRQAYRKLAFQYHPDKNKDNPATNEKMQKINEAYATLSDSEKRGEYDALRERYGDLAYEQFRQTHSSEDIFRGSDINQILDEFARMYGFRSTGEIFGQVYGSGYRTFEFRRQGLSGKGFIFSQAPGRQHWAKDQPIPGTQRRMPEIPFQGILGALVKRILQKSLGMQFPEKGKDWKDVVTLSQEQVSAGSEVEYIHKKYAKPKKLMVKIPAGIKNGQRIKLRGMGAPGKGGGESGNMYLEIRVKVPILKRIKGIFK